MKTIVDTNGRVLQVGTQGLQVVSEDFFKLMDIDEVSDDKCINVFIQTDQTLHSMEGADGADGADKGRHEICISRIRNTTPSAPPGLVWRRSHWLALGSWGVE